jgi:hypothetical protein
MNKKRQKWEHNLGFEWLYKEDIKLVNAKKLHPREAFKDVLHRVLHPGEA